MKARMRTSVNCIFQKENMKNRLRLMNAQLLQIRRPTIPMLTLSRPAFASIKRNVPLFGWKKHYKPIRGMRALAVSCRSYGLPPQGDNEKCGLLFCSNFIVNILMESALSIFYICGQSPAFAFLFLNVSSR